MITSINIKNFQSLKDIEIDLGKFTVIVGESDIGKSSIIRAVKYATTNQSGQSFIKRNEKHTEVTLVFNDKKAVKWHKDKSSTYVTQIEKKISRYEKVGRTVPEDVKGILQINEISIGDDNFLFNIASQFDPPFLITFSPIQRAKIIGDVSGINTLYLAMVNARKNEQSLKKGYNNSIESLNKIQEKLTEYNDLPKFYERLQQYKILLDKTNQLNFLKSTLLKLSEQYKELIQQRELLVDDCERLKNLNSKYSSIIQDIVSKQAIYNSLISIKNKILDIRKTKESSIDNLNRLRDEYDHIKKQSNICPTCLRPV